MKTTQRPTITPIKALQNMVKVFNVTEIDPLQAFCAIEQARQVLEVTPKPKPVSNLVFFIESHCGCAVEQYDGPGAKTIKVSSDIRQADGTIERQTEVIPATLKAVKDWLGY